MLNFCANSRQAVGNWHPGNGTAYLLHVVAIDAQAAELLHCMAGALRVTLANHPTMPSIYVQQGALPHVSYIATSMGIDFPDAEALADGIRALLAKMKDKV